MERRNTTPNRSYVHLSELGPISDLWIFYELFTFEKNITKPETFDDSLTVGGESQDERNLFLRFLRVIYIRCFLSDCGWRSIRTLKIKVVSGEVEVSLSHNVKMIISRNRLLSEQLTLSDQNE